MMASLVGSTKEPLACLLFLVLYIYYTKPQSTTSDSQMINIAKWSLIFLLVSIITIIILHENELPRIRLFDYGEGLDLSSLMARMDIMKRYGYDQLISNPVVGDIGVEYKYGGAGMYIHSIISVQTHLGLLGSLSLFGYLAHRLYYLYRTDNYLALKIVTPSTLFISAIATYFTWIPLWFLIGALLCPRFIKSDIVYR